jgi:CubicO group peptidase (beta-lactamase class C family)
MWPSGVAAISPRKTCNTFTCGYNNFAATGCEPGDTIDSCLARDDKGVQTAAAVDRFSYNGGHMQKHASLPAPGMDLGALGSVALATEMRRLLGADIVFTFSRPQPAGGVRASARNYAVFLRKLLDNQLKMGAFLGSQKVCTNPATCATALNTPVPDDLSWNYSMGHWVEDDPATGDGAFSSAGAFGFYPWVDASNSWYGVVARSDGAGGSADSALCGALIRSAWATGVAL